MLSKGGSPLLVKSRTMQHVSRSQALGFMAGAALLPRVASAQNAPVKVRVGSVAADTYAEAYYALDLGLFDKAGLSVEIVPFNNGAAMAAAAAGGSIDAGVGDATELANGVNRGLPFVLIAGGGMYSTNSPTTTLCVAKSSTLARASDLEGQSVAVISLVSLQSSALKSWLSQNGADISKIHFLELPFPQMAPAIARGTVAAALLSEPIMSDATNSDARIFAKVYDAIGKQFLISDWFSTRDWVAKNSDVAKRFVGVIYDTARWANAHHDESAAILAKYTKLDVDKVKRMNRCAYATDLRPAMVQPVLDTAFKYNALQNRNERDDDDREDVMRKLAAALVVVLLAALGPETRIGSERSAIATLISIGMRNAPTRFQCDSRRSRRDERPHVELRRNGAARRRALRDVLCVVLQARSRDGRGDLDVSVQLHAAKPHAAGAIRRGRSGRRGGRARRLREFGRQGVPA